MVLCGLPFFLAVIAILLHKLVGMTTNTWSYDASFHVFPKGLPHWFFEVEKYKNWVVSGFRDGSLFKVNVDSRAGLKPPKGKALLNCDVTSQR